MLSEATLTTDFCNIVRSVVGNGSQIALHEPSFDLEDQLTVQRTIQSGWVSYQGEMVKKFEEALATYLQIPSVVLMVNGTTALFMALKCLEIGPGHEVLIPATTFAATASAVCHVGATPHFIDSNEQTLGIDLEKLEHYLTQISDFDVKGNLINKQTGKIIKAIIPVYIFGAAFDIASLQLLAAKFNLQIIEDSAEALGSNYHEQKISGQTGIGILSFNGNKIITTGGGGAVALKDPELAQRIRHMSTTAKKPHAFEFDHTDIGYNLRMPALNAALGYSQFQKIDEVLTKKRKLYNAYVNKFAACDIGTMFDPDRYGQSNCWLNAFVLNEDQANLKTSIISSLIAQGIAARPLWKPLPSLEVYQQFPSAICDTANKLYQRVICLPSSPGLIT